MKFVKGELAYGVPATICFFDEVDYWSVKDFCNEMDEVIRQRPSEITILINSTGGCCVEGMTVFSKILNCKIPTTCVIEGIAASMGSVIWAAGDKCKMRDYALLMVHNPWMSSDTEDEDTKRTIEAFSSQLKTIYTKRFGLDEDKITKLMNGEEGVDGTFFTAKEAVEAGFITEGDIIETPGVDKAAAALDLGKVVNAFKMESPQAAAALMRSIMGKNKDFRNMPTIEEKEGTSFTPNTINDKMNQEFSVMAALLGFSGEEATEKKVSARVKELVKSETELADLRASFDKANGRIAELTTELEGSKASVENLKKNLADAQDSLNAYKTAEEEARKNAINAMLDECIAAGKISKESRETWFELADKNMELAKNTLESIPAREDIQQQIVNDEANKKDVQTGLDEEAKIKAKVEEVVGKGFAFQSLDKQK